jgi:hypothetical protein
MTDGDTSDSGEPTSSGDVPQSQMGWTEQTINGQQFMCEPKTPGATYDPAGGIEWTDATGAAQWCVPFDKWHKIYRARRYNREGRIDSDIVD